MVLSIAAKKGKRHRILEQKRILVVEEEVEDAIVTEIPAWCAFRGKRSIALHAEDKVRIFSGAKIAGCHIGRKLPA